MKAAKGRFRRVHVESLETRQLLDAAPIAVADQYEIEKDTTLSAARPVGTDSFATDFNDGALGPHLSGPGFAVLDGKVHRIRSTGINDRAYVRTVSGNFLDVDFRFEVSLTTFNALDTAIYYVGIGRGVGDPSIGNSEPRDSLFLRMHGPNTANGYIGVSNNPASDFDVMGSLPFPGTRRLRIDKLGNTLTFSIDQDYSGTFVPDLSYVVADIAATAPFLTGQNTHLFFGTAIARDYFDDVAVEVLTPPGVLSNDTDDDGDVLSAELTSGPSHGTLTLLNNGTFTYQPEPGFLGTDSFTYVALDAELRSDPAEVTIVVSSTNVAPVGVADHYEIAQDSNLEAKRRTGVDLDLDFEDGTLFPYLEATGFFVVQDGVVRRLGAANHDDRAYVRTKQTDFLESDFRYEVSLSTSITNTTAIYYVGIGSGSGVPSIGNSEPQDSLFLRIHGPNVGGGVVGIANTPANHFETIGFLPEPGTHRLRVEKVGQSATFSIDQHFAGEFVADISYTVDDLAVTAPFLTDSNSRLFFGTAIEEDYFDDFSVTFLTPAGVLANDTDEDDDVLSAELLTGPSHGTLVLESDGTFTYTPQAGFVGSDSFTYRAQDSEAASEPTEVSISVTSTNVAPIAVPDFYPIGQGETLQTTVPSTTERVSQQVFFTNFDAGVPAAFTGTTTLARVQGYAGVGTGENVFAGQMLRNRTGMAFDFLEEPASSVIPTRLVLDNLPEHESVDVRFLLTAMDSWDGNTPLPDIMAVAVDGEVVFVETLDQTDLADQSYVPPPGALLVHNSSLGFNPAFRDAAYDMSFEPRLQGIPHTSRSITIEWFAYGQGWTAAFREDESWGIDNVEVRVNSTVRSPAGVLGNDSDPNGQPLSAVLETGSSHGDIQVSEDGSFLYTPDTGFTGTDSFAYRATDGLVSSEPAWVTIEVRPGSESVITIDDQYDVTPDQEFVVGQRLVVRDIGSGVNDDTGQKLGDLASDEDYVIVLSPGGIYTGQTPTVMPGEQPIGGYLPDSGSAGSRWIGARRELPSDFSVEPGEYVFETTVELSPQIAARTALVQGLRLAADDGLVTMLVNDVPVLREAVGGFDRLTDLGDVGLGAFHPGVNVIRFHVVNGNGGRNPMGLRVEGQVVGQRAPGFGEITGVLANDFLSGFSTVGTQVVSVGGTSDPWLAGMPDGTLASFVDLAPAQSPVQVASLSLRAGDVLRFDAAGNATNSHNLQVFPITGPDGGFFLHHESGAEHGISDVHAPVNSLVGVFLDRFQPNFFTPPATLDFRPGGNVPGGVNYTRLEPALRQAFFIGDGWTSGGQQQEVVVPQGATRLFLGTMDGFEWANNIGRFDVQVRTSGDIPIGATLEESPSHGQVQLAPDGGFTYIPETGFVGLDRFTYLVSNGSGETAVGRVVLQVGDVRLPGDIDSDGEVAFADFVILAEHFGQSEVTRAEGDLDGDGAVTFADFVILADNFGRKASDVDLADLSSGMASES